MKLLSSPSATLPTRFTVASKCQQFPEDIWYYATYVILAVREPNPQGEGERNTANHSRKHSMPILVKF